MSWASGESLISRFPSRTIFKGWYLSGFPLGCWECIKKPCRWSGGTALFFSFKLGMPVYLSDVSCVPVSVFASSSFFSSSPSIMGVSGYGLVFSVRLYT